MTHGYRPYDQIQRSLTISSWVNIIQVTLLSMMLVFFVWRQPTRQRLEEVAEITMLAQGRVVLLEEKIEHNYSILNDLQRQVKELASQVALLQNKKSGVIQ